MSASAWLDLIRDTHAWVVLMAAHEAILRTLLILLGLSSVAQSLRETFHNGPSASGMEAPSPTARNQLRAFHGLTLGLGLTAFWAAAHLAQARLLVQGIGLMLIPAALARYVSIRLDGPPHWSSRLQLGIELGLGLLFLLWPPE